MEDRPLALITGASRGIGAAIACEMAAAGWNLSLGLRNPDSAPLHGPGVFTHAFDALNPASEADWVAATLGKFGRIDGLVLNAGIMVPGTVLAASSDDFDRIMAVNVKSPMRLAQLCWPALEASQGRVIILSSLSGKRVKSSGSGLYAMSKFAVTGLAAGLRQCGKDSGVRTTAICPSFVASDMSEAISDVPQEEMTRPQDIATLVRTVLTLPSTASISEIPISYAVEDCY